MKFSLNFGAPDDKTGPIYLTIMDGLLGSPIIWL